jgi:hypothetical protein
MELPNNFCVINLQEDVAHKGAEEDGYMTCLYREGVNKPNTCRLLLL